ncbi:hypothetical protein [Paenibacillus alvei]|uniref:Lipoprotein n=1 Tax=Paenibacillus alvei TaxID=44250 RepID=A0AAP7A578_PAEAL|nr:hypothetical protein [Paenibacillus alvei]NOJ73576.1 hypothetical protein [Paenibacillus alvei]
MKKIALLLLGGMLLLTGCGSSTKLSTEEICIKKQGGDEKICYGMPRLEAESVAGKGQEDMGAFKYGNGLIISYRDNKVASITLNDDSKDYYEQYPSGIKVGDLKDAVKARYGEKVTYESKGVDSINFLEYDIYEGEIIPINDLRKTEKKGAPEEYIQYNVQYNRDGYITFLTFGELLAYFDYRSSDNG